MGGPEAPALPSEPGLARVEKRAMAA